MPALYLLDATLRDGGYVNNWDFSQDLATALVDDLAAAGIDFIEIGYRNFPAGHPHPGLTGRCPDGYIKAIRAAAPEARLSVMYTPEAVIAQDLDTLAELGVAMVRCSILAGGLETALPLIRHGYQQGMISAGNLTTATEYELDAPVRDCNALVEAGCSLVYVADTNGSMTPTGVRALFELLKAQAYPIPLGFHNHNNLGLALANALAAIQAGAAYLDCTLRGIGRAAGNVPTESLVTLLHQQQQAQQVDDFMVLAAANYLVQSVPAADLKPTLQDMALGKYDFFTNVQPFITAASEEYGISWYTLIAHMASLNLDKPNITLMQVRAIAHRLAVRA